MRFRVGVVAASALLACAFALQGQENMYKIDLDPSGSMVSLNEPILMSGKYVFRAWPDGAETKLRQVRVRKITQLTGATHETIYQIELIPSGKMIARDNPTLRGKTYVFHTWRDGTLMSLRQADVRKVTPLTGNQAFWATEELDGASEIGNLAMQGASKVVVIGTPPNQGDSSQAGAQNASSVGSHAGISGAPAGNWSYQGQPGVSDAWGPANATMSNGVPTMPAATSGGAPPQ